MVSRCTWSETNELFIPYHDEEWGVPSHDDRYLFELLNLEGAQAGLSWLTVLKKRDRYKEVFDNFNAHKIAQYDNEKRLNLLDDPGIIRNRLKVNAAIENAKAYIKAQEEFGSFEKYIWSFVQGNVLTSNDHDESVAISEIMSKELKKRGFKFVGPTICYAFMQAVGIINDHSPHCFRYKEIATLQ